jgi:Phage integrase family
VLFPRPTKNIDGTHPIASPTYRMAPLRWLSACDIRDEHGQPAHLTPHQWRHTLGTRLINRDVPQEVVRRILDHDSAQMTGHYARLHDTTVRRQWEAARKVDIHGATIIFDLSRWHNTLPTVGSARPSSMRSPPSRWKRGADRRRDQRSR